MVNYYDASAHDVAVGVLDYWDSGDEDHFDAVDAFLAAEESEPERAWEIALSIAEQTDNDKHLGQLGAGVFAALLRKYPDWALERLKKELVTNSRIARALSDVRLSRDDQAFRDFVALMNKHGLQVSGFIAMLLEDSR